MGTLLTIHDALLEAHAQLNAAHIPSSWLDAELLLSHVLQRPRAYVTSHAHDHLDNVTIQQFNSVTIRRSRGEPLAYTTGEKEFYGLTFKVTKDVLIPRPATEELVECISNKQETGNNNQTVIVEIGTGSGCIAVTLAKQIPHATIIATDISQKALAIARENATRHGVADRIIFLHGDLLVPITQTNNLPLTSNNWILVANLPYVPTPTLNLKLELSFEPHTALDGGPDGTLLYRRLLNQLAMNIEQFAPIMIALEVDDSMADTLLRSEEMRRLSTWYTYGRQNHVFSFHSKRS
jgi:release factor glutamine methyltransferase